MRACLRDTDSTFEWTESAQASFEEIKHLLVESPALALFDFVLHTINCTNATDYGLGAVMSQIGPEKTGCFCIQDTPQLKSANMLLWRRKLSPAAGLWSGGRLTCGVRALTILLTMKGVQ